MYDKVKLGEILLEQDFRTLDDHGKPYPPSSVVYRQIADKMKADGSAISAKHVYVTVRENRNGYKDRIEKAFAIQAADDSSVFHSTVGSLDVTPINMSENIYSQEFDLILSPKNWLAMKPVRKIYSGRAYFVLQPGWTDILADKLWQQQKLECVVKFKKHNVHFSSSAKSFVHIQATCVQCNATLTGTLFKEPANNVEVKIHFNVKNIHPNAHTNTKKRQLKGKIRRKVADIMISQRKNAITYRREEAMRLKEFGDNDPPILPSSNVLRKAKEQRLLQQHGLVFANPALNLANSATSGKYAGSIHSISLMPFYCMYWSPEQQLLYSARLKKDSEAFMTIDATGGIAKRTSSQDPPIFLYQCMIVTSEGSLPVFQMLSADHKALHIAHFLRKISSNGVKAPRMVVSDFGWGFLIALAEVFAKCVDLRDYLRRCHNIPVLAGDKCSIPACFLRLDVSHLIAMVARWKCLKGKDRILVRRFYLRCIGQAYQMTTLDSLQYLVESILVAALSQTVGCSDFDGEPLLSDTRVHFLNDAIKGAVIGDNLEKDESEDDTSQDDKANDDYDAQSNTTANWTEWSQSLFESAQGIAVQSVRRTTLNALFNTEFAKQFKTRLMPYLPLWTGLMRPYFQVGREIATSSSVESEFADLKTRAFNGELPIRADKFVLRHMDYIDGKIKLASNATDKPESYSINERQQSEDPLNNLDSYQVDKSNDWVDEPSTDSGNEGHNISKNERHNISRSPETRCSFGMPDVKRSTGEVYNSSTNYATASSTVNNSETHLDFEHELMSSSIKSSSTCILQRVSTSPIIDTTNENADISELPPVHILEANDQVWNTCEDWRGQVSKSNKKEMNACKRIAHDEPSKKLKTTYLEKCPEWDFIKHARSQTIPLMRNGNLCKPVKLAQITITLRRTCAFDSILQIAATGISMAKAYEERAHASKNPTLQLAISILREGKITPRHLTTRAEILVNLGIYRGAIVSFTRGIKRLNANCNVADLADYIFEDDRSFARKNQICLCGSRESRRPVALHVDVGILLNKGLDYIQEAIDNTANIKSTCNKCKETVDINVEYGSHAIIDTSVSTDSSYTNRNKELRHILDTISKTIILGGKTFLLAGVAHYIEGIGIDDGHYIAYGYGGARWYEYNDLDKNRKTVSSQTVISPHIIIYVSTT